MKRVLVLTQWAIREPTPWRVSLLLFLILVFSLASGLSPGSGSYDKPPEETLENTLYFTAAAVVLSAYPFLFPLISVLATLALVVHREAGGLAALQALGFRRGEIYLAHTLSILALALFPALMAFLVLPPLAEPGLAAKGNVAALYPFGYWASMPRLFLTIAYLALFASAFAMIFRRAAVAFSAMVAFFFVGFSLRDALRAYGVLSPPGAFHAAYDFAVPLHGLPIDPNYVFTLHLLAAILSFMAALAYASRRGELH